MKLQALIFDVDGTLAETEEVHRKAFNQAFAEAGLDWHWSKERYRELLATSGGKERIRRYMEEEQSEQLHRHDLDAWIAGLHQAKTRLYAELMAAGEAKLRPGVERLIREAHAAGLRLAIATTTSMANITALFDATMGHEVLGWFEVIGAAEQAPVKKPDSSVYLWVLEQLDLSPEVCLAIEDTRNGVLAARGAKLPVLVTESYYSQGEDFSGAVAVLSDLGEPHSHHQVLEGTGRTPGWVDPTHLNEWIEAIA
ncbi:MAG TPA: HAD family hydrolase [Thiolapillus brandeum]|uniref:HAD family hydrolase n=1 Tax=Thiolapillus brandeum TaxID=1076588 RepID=A0A831KCM1_9GAMM|nr:HAD family hydrolase [Thiolapillus brandeum]